jgi:hypothetical protein
MFGLERWLGGSRGNRDEGVTQEDRAKQELAAPVQNVSALKIPAGARTERGLSLQDAVGHACFAIAMSQEAVIVPTATPGQYDLHTSAKRTFDTRGFSETIRLDADYWNQTVTHALRQGKTVWTTDVNYNDYDIKTLANARS